MQSLSRKVGRTICALAAFVAMSAALAQSLCAPQEPGALAYPDCCVSLADDAVHAAAATLAPAPESFPVPAATAAPCVLLRPAHATIAAFPPDSPPISRPYHARSARSLS